jgi:hypothetical protein
LRIDAEIFEGGSSGSVLRPVRCKTHHDQAFVLSSNVRNGSKADIEPSHSDAGRSPLRRLSTLRMRRMAKAL